MYCALKNLFKAASFQMVVNSQMCLQPPVTRACQESQAEPAAEALAVKRKGHEAHVCSPGHPGYILMMEKREKKKVVKTEETFLTNDKALLQK